jgi:hypothetical protein
MARMHSYSDGARVEVGDSVLFEGGKTPGVVVEVVDTEAQMAACGVREPGVMLRSPPFGLVYLSDEILEDDPLVLEKRGEPV